MLQDQASSLRQLKKLRDYQASENFPSKDEFIANISRPTGFPTIALVVPDGVSDEVPPLQEWIHGLVGGSSRACIWDQAGLLSVSSLLPDCDQIFPTLKTVETDRGPLLVLPRFPDFRLLTVLPEIERIKFARNLFRTVGSISELWIVLRASELHHCQAALQATDLACIIAPDHPDAILKSYEAVKAIHLSGYFSTFGLIVLNPREIGEKTDFVKRIKSVAKQFLSLDLVPAGVVLSGQGSENCINSQIRELVGAIDLKSTDFQYFLGERLLYPIPGDRGQ